MVVEVVSVPAAAGLAVGAEQGLELLEEVRLRAEVAEVVVAGRGLLRGCLLHRGAVVAVVRVTLDHRGGELLPPEDVGERAGHRRGAGPGGAGDGDDGVLD